MFRTLGSTGLLYGLLDPFPDSLHLGFLTSFPPASQVLDMPHPAFILQTLLHQDKLDPLVFRFPGPLPPGLPKEPLPFSQFHHPHSPHPGSLPPVKLSLSQSLVYSTLVTMS